jgi:protein TonB
MILNLNLKIMSNFASNLYKSEWIDLVFKNRNKSYGAYMLRSESSSITLKALLLTVPVFIFIIAGPSVYKKLNPDKAVPVETYHPVTLAEIAPAVKHEVKKVELPKVEPELKKIKTVKLTANIAVVKDPVAEPPTLDDIKEAVIGQISQAGEATKAPAAAIVSSGNGEGTAVPEADNTVYEAGGIDRYPEFEGGMTAWAKFIQRNLRYPGLAQENEVQGKVFISFVVEIDGSISDVKVLKGIGSGCDEEAIRVIRKSPKWKAGQQNDRKVRVRYTMPLAFQLAQ